MHIPLEDLDLLESDIGKIIEGYERSKVYGMEKRDGLCNTWPAVAVFKIKIKQDN